jgi:hypothetical protein
MLPLGSGLLQKLDSAIASTLFSFELLGVVPEFM